MVESRHEPAFQRGSSSGPFTSNELNAILAQELAAGNSIHQDEGGWGAMRRLIVLKASFCALRVPMRDGLEHHVINDPHYWQEEIVDTRTNEMLACKFAAPGER